MMPLISSPTPPSSRRLLLISILLPWTLLLVSAATHSNDYLGLTSLQHSLEGLPPDWAGTDPCGSKWTGIICTDNRVTTIALPNMGLSGHLPGDIDLLSELQQLVLSYNSGITGPLQKTIGNLKKLTNLVLVGCSFNGPIPDSIGSLQQVEYLSLNSNNFVGSIPSSIGNMTNLEWLDLADNRLSGSLPVNPGLDTLTDAKHFHLGNNRLSGVIPPTLFSSSMQLIHLLLEGNQLTGSIPTTIGLVQTLEVLRLDSNLLNGTVPSNITNLTSLTDLYLSNNLFTGPLPDLSPLGLLNYLDMSNNSFDASSAPGWTSLLSLTTLIMEYTRLGGQPPASLFSYPSLQSVQLRGNALNGTLYLGSSYSTQLTLLDMQGNHISVFNQNLPPKITVSLVGNPVCDEFNNAPSYCKVPKSSSTSSSSSSSPSNNCSSTTTPCSSSGSGQVRSPTCKCANPYSGTMLFRSIQFSDFGNSTYYFLLQQSLIIYFDDLVLPVDSIYISNPQHAQYLQVFVQVFPSGQDTFNRTSISMMAYLLSNQNFTPPKDYFGPYVFHGQDYTFQATAGSGSTPKLWIMIGSIVGGCALLLLLILTGVYAFRQKRRAERAATENSPFASWDPNKSSGSIPQLKGARWFSFEELTKCTRNFSEANIIGSGGYGKVYRGTLQNGQLVAIKRSQQGSMQGGLEFKTEIELLSRLHHKNLVGLVGFCFDQGEQMLVYEYIPNGSLNDSLSGKSGIRLDWFRRLKVALGTARGLAYLHEFANPPIIHRDIKTANILLDENLNAKVTDFGLSKLMSDAVKRHVSTTQVKGTMGYLDPEYYMTQQLTEKSDVYGFGVVLLELITGRRPLEHGKYIVKEVRTALNRNKPLYNLAELLDSKMGLGGTLKGLERLVDLAMACVEESGADRPAMHKAVKVIESIMQMAGLNPNAESGSASANYEGSTLHPYNNEFFDYSATYYPPSTLEAK